jgi:hypothetical protein
MLKTCHTCRGFGIIESPVWRLFFADCHAGKYDARKESDILRWARANGYDTVESMGKEEPDCPDCLGTGVIPEIQAKLLDITTRYPLPAHGYSKQHADVAWLIKTLTATLEELKVAREVIETQREANNRLAEERGLAREMGIVKC